MIQAFNGKRPVIASTAFVHETAVIIGDVHIGEASSVWPNAVLRADFAAIRIGNRTHIEDCSVIHGLPSEIGDDVTIGHSVVIHCSRIGSHILIGNNATILDDAEIGDYCMIAAGAVVTSGTKVPPRSLVMGIPGKISPLTPEQMQTLEWWLDPDGPYPRMMRQYLAQGIGVPPQQGPQ